LVKVHLTKQSKPVKIIHVLNTYQKGDMFCVEHYNGDDEREVDKFPIDHIFRVKEPY